MKLLLHTCCAPCSIYCIEYLKELNIIGAIYWYNPNIHPHTEYTKRKQELEKYTNKLYPNDPDADTENIILSGSFKRKRIGVFRVIKIGANVMDTIVY